MILLFEETRKISKEEFAQNVVESLEKTAVYDSLLSGHSEFRKKESIVRITSGSSVDTASKYSGKKISILNFASAYNPGGGVLNGATAQEEVLCRCSTLYEVLSSDKCFDQYYRKNRSENSEFGSDRIIYSPGIIFFRRDQYEFPKEIEPFIADVITCAAPNLRNKEFNPDVLKNVLYRRYKRIFETACLYGTEILVLGAIGCGVFKNPADIVANVMMNLCMQYPYFEEIVFPIYKSESTYRSFLNEFSRMKHLKIETH